MQTNFNPILLAAFSMISGLFVSPLAFAQQVDQAADPSRVEATANIHFSIFPRAAANGAPLSMRIVDSATGLQIGEEIRPSSGSLLWWMSDVHNVKYSGPEVDGRDVVLTAKLSGSTGLGTANSEVFPLRAGRSPLQKLHFPKVGILEIEVPKFITQDGEKIPLDVQHGIMIDFLRSMDEEGRPCEAIAHSKMSNRWVSSDRLPAKRTFNSIVLDGFYSDQVKVVESKDSTVYWVGFVATGHWQVVVSACGPEHSFGKSQSKWISKPIDIKIEANDLAQVKLAAASLTKSVVVKGTWQDHAEFLYVQAWFGQGNGAAMTPQAIDRNDDFDCVVPISAACRNLFLVAPRIRTKADYDQVWFASFNLPGNLDGIPSTLQCWPDLTIPASIVMPKAETATGLCFLEIHRIRELVPDPSLFPLEGVRVQVNPICRLYGLPPGEYQITRVASQEPNHPIDTITVIVE